MNDEPRPNPDTLLQALNQADLSGHKGKLSIFFGMAAGVGKTYAMLEAAQNRMKDGVDVAVGIVETHDRNETEALLTGLETIPRMRLSYRNASLRELNLDAVLTRRPALVLIDELAHTNVPGSRHEKRWQDVLEILDAGIDVYTTLNVQHIESRKENVEAITGITVHETVPDSVLERASQIELIDITPDELLKRLREGKVYLGDMADRAALRDRHVGTCSVGGEERVSFEILVGAPVLVPTGRHQHSFAGNFEALEVIKADLSLPGGHAHHHCIEISQALQRQLRQIQTVGVAMKRRIHIGSRIGHHLDFADVEFRSGGIAGSRRFAAQVVTDDRRRQPFVGHHPVFHSMAQINQGGFHFYRR